MSDFQPRFIFESELSQYGLGNICNGNTDAIMDLIDTASTTIDEYCGRTDGDGNGSLVYTTYVERILAQAPGRNIYVVPHRPMVAITLAQVNALSGQDIASGNNFYTGVQPSVNTLADGTLSPIISASGRYVAGRRDNYGFGDEPYSYINPLNTQTLFGAPPPWNLIDMVNLDYDSQTGQLWLAAGLYLARYSEIVLTYNSGYDPNFIPKPIKRACAGIVRNLIAKNNVTGMKSFNSSKIGVSAEYDADLVDINIARLLANYITVRMA